ncbi:SH3 domain-binding protein 4-like [Branchiostoma floridae]|uniref:SH3 domain-binding protein 4-like n=1 Tax=Branchiostoma floridae TaxID=7739 RepID=A0A9J7M1T7_BRAFL|nr:SH3 domain-binding protein 4-like [Branchiostoma floridae]
MTTNSSASGDRESPVLSPREAGEPFTYTPSVRPKKRSAKNGQRKKKKDESNGPPCRPEFISREVGSDGGVIETTCKDVVLHIPRNHSSEKGVQNVTVTVTTDRPPEAQGPQKVAVAPLVKVELSEAKKVEKNIVVDIEMDTRIKDEENSTHIACLRSSSPASGFEEVDRRLYRMLPGNIIRLLLQRPLQENFIMVVAKTVKEYVWDTLERKVTFAVFGPWVLQTSMVPVLFYSSHGRRGLLAWYDSLKERMGSSSQAEGHVQWGESYDLYVDKPQKLEVMASLEKTSCWTVKDENEQKIISKEAVEKRWNGKHGFVVSKKSGKKTDPFALTLNVKPEEKSRPFVFHVATPAGPPDSAPTSPRLKRRRRGTPQRKLTACQNAMAPSVIICDVVKAKVTRRRSQWYQLDYDKGQLIPVLTNQGVFGHSEKVLKEYWVGYTDGRVGFFRRDDVEIVEGFRREVCPTKDGLLRSLLEPCRHLKFNYNFIRQEVVSNLVKWPRFARQVGFNEADIEDIKVRHRDDSKEQVAAMMEDLRQRTGEGKPELLMTVMEGLFRCGIPYKKVDCPHLALKILLDSVLYTVALSTHPNYMKLGAELGYNIIHLMRINKQCKGASRPEKACQPEYTILQEWQAQKWSGKRQDPVDMLQWLHIVVQEMGGEGNPNQEFRHIQGVILFLLCYKRIPL